MELEVLFNHVPTSICKQCGRKFPAAGKRAYCSESCAEQAQYIYRRIGGTSYKVKVVFSGEAQKRWRIKFCGW